MERALLRLDKNPILKQPLEHSPDVLHMFLKRRRKNQYVIQVNIYELIYHVSQHVIDECLENCGTVGQPKRYDPILKVPPGGIKSSFPLIPPPLCEPNDRCYVNLIWWRWMLPATSRTQKTSTAKDKYSLPWCCSSLGNQYKVAESHPSSRQRKNLPPLEKKKGEWSRLLENQKYVSPWPPFQEPKESITCP